MRSHNTKVGVVFAVEKYSVSNVVFVQTT